MIALPSLSQLDRASATRIWLCTGPTDMRRGFDRLAEQVGRREAQAGGGQQQQQRQQQRSPVRRQRRGEQPEHGRVLASPSDG